MQRSPPCGATSTAAATTPAPSCCGPPLSATRPRAFGSATELQAGFTAHNGINGRPNALTRFTGFELDGKKLRIFE
ncbi:DNA-directed RNA polymerase subunit beta [Leifsonia xyli subsp. cynodontis DSM 46306]|uniref:Uncharacterized protein n=1 Tax=Leifsonia xyli subsp. cynodontis DSM 46306 TaxID=1389489 RepID=U3PEI6_LEIXC|nr:hypothetical protein [Leifsonia xyli]AGW42003.1 DNA-directed RNA polymerase subunit beta [Leifsonia xyli subsp. cynodontis DSM 46306]